MSRILVFLTFLIVFSSLYFGIHFFIYSVISHKLALSTRLLLSIKWLFWIGGSSFIIGNLISRFLNIQLVRQAGEIWFGLISIVFTFIVVGFLLSLLRPSLARPLIIVSIVLSTAVFAASLINYARGPLVKTISVPLAKPLPAEMVGFSITQLSDLHIHNGTSKRWLSDIVEQTNELDSDLIVVTGDLIEDGIRPESGFPEILRNLKATCGVVAVTGNHEYYAGMDNFLGFASQSNIKVLRNEHLSLMDGALYIVGINDDAGRNVARLTGPDHQLAFAQVPVDKPVIVLYHRPTRFELARSLGADLQLSGHTHRGQIPPYNFFVDLLFKYHYGWYREQNSYIYTSPGTSLWGPPMRFPGRSEIVHFILAGRT